MKNKFLFALMLLASCSFVVSCTDDDSISDDEYSSERLFMPMFRKQANTNNSSDEYACAIASEAIYSTSNRVNDVQLYWYGVEGAIGYELASIVQGTDWDENRLVDTIVSPDILEYLDEDLQYGVGYRYAIRALSDKGEAYHSKWYGHGDGSHQNDYLNIETGERYDVPIVFWVEDVDYNSLRVYFDAEAESGYETTYEEFFENGAEVDEDGNWVFDELTVTPTSDNPNLPSLSHTMTADDYTRGYVDFDGLVSNATYIVTGRNNNVARTYDKDYNKLSVRMKGDAGDPILIAWEPDLNDTILVSTVYNATDLLGKVCRIDTILDNYMSDNDIAEGQIYYLEGGKEYYFTSSVSLTKGFTLETNPEDIAAGKGRATVYLGVGSSDESGYSPNNVTLMLSRNAKSGSENGIMFSFNDITFNEINFTSHVYYTYWDKSGSDGDSGRTISANYFLNMYSQGLGFTLSALNITNCSFSGMIRGFVRFQGPNRQIIQNLKVDGCVFYDCGHYDANGRGYSWFAGPSSNKNSNFFQNFTLSNCTFISSSHHAVVSEGTSALAWPDNTHWNITIENNTFINQAPMSSSSGHGLLLETRYAPDGSKFTVKKNLFVLVRKGDDDTRNLYQRGMRINNYNVEYDFSDNYATTVPDWTTSTLTDGLFTNYAFSDTSNGAGYQSGGLNAGGYSETRIKFGDNRNENEDDAVGYQLTPEELFQDPAPLAVYGYKDMHRHNNDGFYYNATEKVMNHPIYTKGIGDQRWKTGANWK